MWDGYLLQGQVLLGDLGYKGMPGLVTVPISKATIDAATPAVRRQNLQYNRTLREHRILVE